LGLRQADHDGTNQSWGPATVKMGLKGETGKGGAVPDRRKKGIYKAQCRKLGGHDVHAPKEGRRKRKVHVTKKKHFRMERKSFAGVDQRWLSEIGTLVKETLRGKPGGFVQAGRGKSQAISPSITKTERSEGENREKGGKWANGRGPRTWSSQTDII